MDRYLQKFFHFILNVLDIFPHWIRDTIILLMGVIAIVALAEHLIKSIKSATNLLDTIAAITRIGTKTLTVVATELVESIESPIKHPRIGRLLKIIFIINGYLSSLLFLVFCVGIAAYVIIFESEGTFGSRMGMLFVGFVCLYFALFSKAQSDRDLLLLKATRLNEEKNEK